MWILKIKYKSGQKHEHMSLDIEYLKELLTLILRRDGHGIIIRKGK